MKVNFKLLSSIATGTLILTGSCFFLNSCQKETLSNTSMQLVSSSKESSLKEAEAFAIKKSSLVAWYSFNNGSLKDRSIYHNDIVFNNATAAIDRNGHAGDAYQFDGASSYMRVKNSPSLSPSGAITLFAIVKVSGFYPGKCHGNRIINKGYNDFINGHYMMGFDDTYYTNSQNCNQPVDEEHESFLAHYGHGYAGELSSSVDTAGFVEKERWYHVAYTYANGVSKMYVDGKLSYPNRQKASFNANNQDLFLGTTGDNINPYWFNGIMDEVMIFNEALSAKEIGLLSKL